VVADMSNRLLDGLISADPSCAKNTLPEFSSIRQLTKADESGSFTRKFGTKFLFGSCGKPFLKSISFIPETLPVTPSETSSTGYASGNASRLNALAAFRMPSRSPSSRVD